MKPARKQFGTPRLLIVGCGDIGLRLLPLLRERFRIFALTQDASQRAALRAAGAVPIIADLDQPRQLARLRGLAPCVVHLAPPPRNGQTDSRTRHLIPLLPPDANVVYISTTGVYGDCGGAAFDETRSIRPQTGRAQRRADAEQALRRWASANGGRLAILRVPGIYAANRLPRERLLRGLPALLPHEDVYTSHIHADDLVKAIILALFRARPNRVYHACDDSELKMGDYFDLVADALQLPQPPRLPKEELREMLPAASLSFMSESRRPLNLRLKQELRLRLRYPQVRTYLFSEGLRRELGRDNTRIATSKLTP
ncbi:MAG: family oxidoreductase [Burkholderiaceae bacterium]|nr:family oxidoreductase [Burkholderiaceae bacterium]